MTADHWIEIAIGIMNAIIALTAAILTPIVASRINQPRPKLETTKPRRRALFIRALKSWPLWLGLSILCNIYGLYLAMRPGPLTLRVVFFVSMNISSIAFCLAMMFILSTLDLLGRMLNSQGKLIDSHGKLADIVGEIITDVASGIEKPDDPPQT